MVDENLRKPRRKPKGKLHLLESPFPIPIQTITGKAPSDKHWYYYFGTLESDHVSISRLGDLTFLYRLGFFGKGMYSRSQPQFEKYKDVLSDQGRKHYLQTFMHWEPEDRDSMQDVYNDIRCERLRQHSSWLQKEVNVASGIKTDDESKDGKIGDGTLMQCTDLHTDIDNMLVEECSSESEELEPYTAPTKRENDTKGADCSISGTKEGGCSISDANEDDWLVNNTRGDNAVTSEDNESSELGHVSGYPANSSVTSNDCVISDALDCISTTEPPTKKKAIEITNKNLDSKGIEDVMEHTDKNDTTVHFAENVDSVETESISQGNQCSFSPTSDTISDSIATIEDSYKLYECVQLTFEEAFFLSFGLGCLTVTDNNHKMNLTEMWNTFATKQNNFIPVYAAYHHFRSKGWVVRFSKIYGLDFVLYHDGMAFHHASYCVIVNFIHEDNFSQNDDQQMSWKKLTALCRINERAGKEVLFCYVVRPRGMTEEDLKTPSCIKQFKIMEVVMRRWLPEKFRDCKD